LALSIGLLAAASPARGGEPHQPANVRPFFSVGYAKPVDFGDYDRGFGIGLGFEVEQSELLSGVFRFDWNELRAPSPGDLYYGSPYTSRALTWSAGARLNWARGSFLQPYSEALLGARMVGESQRYYAYAARGPSETVVDPDGLAGIVCFGLSTASRGHSGFFIDGGYEFSLEHPDRYAIVPVRFGVVFP
jgi:hypothetical protein